MTDFLAKPLEVLLSRQSDQVVGDHGKRPVCLNALPGAHEHLAESQVLLDLLVKGLDPKPLLVQSHGLLLGHGQIVADQEPGFCSCALGNEKGDHPDFGQENDSFGDPEPLFLGGTDDLVISRSLGQVTDDRFDAVVLHNPVPFDGRDESSARCRDKIENRSTGIPAVHKNGEGSVDPFAERSQNACGQIDFALKISKGARGLGTISSNVPTQPHSPDFDNTSHGALSFDETVAGMMDSHTFDHGTLSLTGGIVDDYESLFGGATLRQPVLAGYANMPDISTASVEKPLKIVGSAFEVTLGNLPRGVELDQTDQSDEINQKVFPLRFAQKSQENGKIRRNFFGCFCAYGFHAVLLALAGIGDFGWKPFYLKQLTSFFT